MQSATLPDGAETNDKDIIKCTQVFHGKDSILKTFGRAHIGNYASDCDSTAFTRTAYIV
ncbi:MAG: hypothetical protein CM15mP53_06150 [Ectothiorhodospiraceae bacterium]|nr:MAG: hypothetical protein CM15mP53_06150 [Ectothiorhodospiraceae bacterium]